MEQLFENSSSSLSSSFANTMATGSKVSTVAAAFCAPSRSDDISLSCGSTATTASQKDRIPRDTMGASTASGNGNGGLISDALVGASTRRSNRFLPKIHESQQETVSAFKVMNFPGQNIK
jgi:hypothetical protein